MIREILYSGPRAGFYVPLRDYIKSHMFKAEVEEEPFLAKVAAALCTGTLGAIIANPIDVVKIRLMVDPQKYPSLFSALSSIYVKEGFVGLYKGLAPSTLRGL